MGGWRVGGLVEGWVVDRGWRSWWGDWLEGLVGVGGGIGWRVDGWVGVGSLMGWWMHGLVGVWIA